jgi:chromosome partitioning protein
MLYCFIAVLIKSFNEEMIRSINISTNQRFMAKFISFCSQKGGVGKTSITAHVATYLAQALQIPVTAFDCDYPQHSLVSIRDSEIERLKSDESYLKRAEKLTSLPYEIIPSKLVDALPKLDEYTNMNRMVFIDIPGTLNVNGLDGFVKRLDAAILLLEADPISFESTMHTVLALANFPNKNGGMVPTYLLWNKFNVHEREERYTNLQEAALNYLETLNKDRKVPIKVKFMEYRIPQSVAIKDYRSTLLPHKTIEPLVSELLESLVPEI